MKGLFARRGAQWLLIAILSLGLGLRLWGISFGLPYMYHPDEGVPVKIALRFLQTGNLNPEFFHWPALLFYLNALVYGAFYLVGWLTGRFARPTDLVYPDYEMMAVGRTDLPEIFLLGRGLSALIGVLTIVLVYLIGREWRGARVAALIAATLIAVEATSVKHSHFIRPDILAIFCALITALFALKVAEEPRMKNYALAGIGIGLTTASKYNGALIFVALVAAHLLRYGWRGFARKEIYLAGAMSVLTFLLLNPFVILDWQRFAKLGPMDDANIYATGHPGAEGDSFQWYRGFLFGNLGWLTPLALAEALLILRARDHKGITLLIFPLIYFVFISQFTVHHDTTILPVVPFVIISAAHFLARAYEFSSQRFPRWRVGLTALLVVVVAWLGLPSLHVTVASDARLLQPDGREQARRWIHTNLSRGSRIALEAYSPYLDRDRFFVDGFYGIQDHAPEWYVANGYEYLIFSQGVYARYFAEPARYTAEINRYNALFARFTPIARFDDGAYEIKVYATGATAPSTRVGVRFGEYADLVELVGYETLSWRAGEPLRVQFFWRALGDKPEPFQVQLRVLDAQDREIAKTQQDLFQGKGWRAEMFADVWTIPVPADAAPGTYRLQVDVIWMRYNFQLPVKTWSGQAREDLVLESFELLNRASE
ncbi:MAG: glycosyltransferase family 39 protein [Chloroflexi bacterium]|nr:glycosyltransferase family 39 protein [Chloroflexota bacterium]